MSYSLNFPFNTLSNYIYDSNIIDITGGNATLKLQQDDIDFTETFDNDTGFTYDTDKAEFTGGLVRQKSILGGRTCGADYATNLDLMLWSLGVVTGTASGGAAISGGKLDLTGGTAKYVDYAALNNADMLQTGCIRFKYTPNYTTAPVSQVYMFQIIDTTIKNTVLMRHTVTNPIRVEIWDSSNTQILEIAAVPNPAFIQGQEYEIELNWDITTGGTYFFIDGILVGSSMNTGTRDNANILRIGNNYSGGLPSDAEYDDLELFSTVQHTANYTPGYSVPEYKYSENAVILPEMEHIGDGTIKLFNSFSTIETGTPKYTIQIARSGNYLYWNGSTWAISDGTYSQATDTTAFNTNCPTLPVNGEKYGQFKLIFPDSNTISSVSELTANMNVDIGYVTTNPTIEANAGIRSDELINYLETSTVTGNDLITGVLKKSGSWYYHDGTNWVVSDSTYAQSNTSAEILANISTFTVIPANIYFKWFLHSDDGTTRPLLDNILVEYSFAGDAPTLITLTYWGYLRTLTTILANETFKVRPAWTIGEKTIITGDWVEITTDSTSYWDVEFVIEDVDPTYLEWWIDDRIYRTNFINNGADTDVKFSELTISYTRVL